MAAQRESRAASAEEERFRSIFRRVHAGHASCIGDEWLMQPCRGPDGVPLDRPWVWSRRNGPWRRVSLLWVGAAPGNAGGRGRGALGAHGTRIPFGGDVAGANLEVLLGAIGMDRNDTFIVAALNRLPDRGGSEPTAAEIRSPAGGYPDSIALLRDTVVACGPRLIVALGNVAARILAAACLEPPGSRAIPALARLERSGWSRGATLRLERLGKPAAALESAWRTAWGTDPFPAAVRLTHPSAQNMSPYAGATTAFHRRMLEARDDLRAAVRETTGALPPAARAPLPDHGIYALPEWRSLVTPRLESMDRLWRERGV